MHEEVFDQGGVETICTHPALSEGVLEVAHAACGRAIQYFADERLVWMKQNH